MGTRSHGTGEAWRRWRSLLASDFERNPFWESRLTLAVWRLGQVSHDVQGAPGFLLRRAHTVVDQVWVRSIIGAELPRSVPAGPGLRMPHAGRGVILHPACRIGAGVTLYHRVTVGVNGDKGPPVLEDGVYLGTGAAVIGAVTVSRDARVGANAVVLRDVPAGATAVGVPATLRARRTTPAPVPPGHQPRV